MKKIKYVIYKEGKYYVSQCLNVDISSFGATIDEASANLKEALQLYFEDVLSGYPELTREDIRACLMFAADRERKLQTI